MIQYYVFIFLVSDTVYFINFFSLVSIIANLKHFIYLKHCHLHLYR